jgi:hypothetical protein
MAVALLAMFVADAAAAGNVIHVQAPGNARQCSSHCARKHKLYSIGLSGHARGTKLLYLFVDYNACASTPAEEHSRANGDIWQVSGDFSEVSPGWHTPRAGPDHVCAYLVRASAPRNPSSGVVAHAFATYTVHS